MIGVPDTRTDVVQGLAEIGISSPGDSDTVTEITKSGRDKISPVDMDTLKLASAIADEYADVDGGGAVKNAFDAYEDFIKTEGYADSGINGVAWNGSELAIAESMSYVNGDLPKELQPGQPDQDVVSSPIQYRFGVSEKTENAMKELGL